MKGTLVDNLKQYRPTRFVGVPRVWEKIEERMRQVGKETKGVKKAIADWAKSMGTRHHDIEMTGKTDNSIGYKIAKKLVLSRVNDALGMGNIAGVGTGSAPTPQKTLDYFKSLDLLMFDLYGSTETVCLAAANLPGPGNYKLGTVGRRFPLSEVQLVDTDDTGAGELITRSRGMFMGYLNNKEKTLESVDDEGWFHTGDLLKQDEDGFLTVVGRMKEIVITAGGENVAPVNIEQQIQKQLGDVVSNVMVVGDQRKFLSCIITLKVRSRFKSDCKECTRQSRTFQYLG